MGGRVHLKSFCMGFLILAMLVSSSFGETYYFSPSGNDANDGLAWGTAKKDLQGFIQTQAVPNTIYLASGEWQMTNSYLAIPANQTLVGDNRQTVLRGTGTNPVIYIVNKTNIWLEGLTITGGSNMASTAGTPLLGGTGGGVVGGSSGGAFFTNQVIINCLVVSNGAATAGGGLRKIGRVIDSEISYNNSQLGGGAYEVQYGTNLFIHHNKSGGPGGGVSSAFIYDSTIYTNVAGTQGGGLNGVSAFDCTVVSNWAGINGGGGLSVYGTNSRVVYNSAPGSGGIQLGSVSNFVVAFNKATGGAAGGGKFDSFASVVVSNTATAASGGLSGGTHYGALIGWNSAGSSAGGSANGKFYSCVFVSNTAVSTVAGVDLASSANLAYNCIFYGHTNNLPAVRLVNGGSLANSILFNNASNVAFAGSSPIVYTNNFFEDPSFLPDSWKLQQSSACIDAGNDTYAVGLDFYGRTRIYGLSVDIGASEWRPDDIPPALAGNGKKGALIRFFMKR